MHFKWLRKDIIRVLIAILKTICDAMQSHRRVMSEVSVLVGGDKSGIWQFLAVGR